MLSIYRGCKRVCVIPLGENGTSKILNLTEGNFGGWVVRQNILNLFTNDSKCFQLFKTNTIAP